MVNMKWQQRRTLYILLGIGIAMLSVGLVLKLETQTISNGEPVSKDSTLDYDYEYQTPGIAFHKEEFQLSTETNPGNTDEYDARSINVYLERDQELIASFRAQGAPIMFQIYTPSNKILGYSLDCLEPNKSVASEEGDFRYKALESGIDEMNIKSATPSGLTNVLVNYWIR